MRPEDIAREYASRFPEETFESFRREVEATFPELTVREIRSIWQEALSERFEPSRLPTELETRDYAVRVTFSNVGTGRVAFEQEFQITDVPAGVPVETLVDIAVMQMDVPPSLVVSDITIVPLA